MKRRPRINAGIDNCELGERALRRHLRRFARHYKIAGLRVCVKVHVENGASILKCYQRGKLNNKKSYMYGCEKN